MSYHLFSGNVIFCEGDSGYLNCPSGEVLTIQSANYGRTEGPSICPHSNIQSTNCVDPKALGVVQGWCQGQNSCSVSANNGVFGDQCVGTRKYLEIAHTCVAPMKEIVCEGQSSTISCPSGSTIHVIYANYGRIAVSVCPHLAVGDTSCSAVNSLSKVQEVCQGQTSCTLASNNAVFTDPCVGIHKYLEVDYICS